MEGKGELNDQSLKPMLTSYGHDLAGNKITEDAIEGVIWADKQHILSQTNPKQKTYFLAVLCKTGCIYRKATRYLMQSFKSQNHGKSTAMSLLESTSFIMSLQSYLVLVQRSVVNSSSVYACPLFLTNSMPLLTILIIIPTYSLMTAQCIP
jgi:hypothetical protein